MKLICFIASTLLIAFISQHSTNGLPIDDVTTQHSCLEGSEFIDGECHPILSSSEKSHKLSKSSEVEKVTSRNQVALERNDQNETTGACPKGTVRGENGVCKDILLGDQLATTLESKKLDETSIEHEKETLDHTVEPTEDEHKEKLQKDKVPEVEKETLDHTIEPTEGEHKEKLQKNKLTEDDKETLDHTVEPIEDERKEKLQKDKVPEVEKETLDHTVEPTEGEHKEKVPKDKLPEDDKETLDYTTESTENNRKSNVPTDNDESSNDNSESFNVPKGCPSGTKADEQGACQDEVEHTSTTLTVNFKNLLPADGSCPSGMEVFKGKCIYIKSKEDALTQETDNVEEDKNEKNNVEDKLVPVLKGGSCPPNTEYSSNGLCRVRTVPTIAKVLTNKEICQADEVLVDGKCQTRDIKLKKSTTIAPETELDTEDKVKSQEKKHVFFQ